MELKSLTNKNTTASIFSSNRTFMELKFGIAVNDFVDEV